MRLPAPTSARLMDGGGETYAAMLDAIGRAREHVDLIVYSFTADDTGTRFGNALARAADRGVRVRVVVDAWGSLYSSSQLADRLERAGCEVTVHNPLRRAWRGAIDRNHRKLLAVDDETLFFGGINIGDEFVGGPSDEPWLDVAVELRGLQFAGLSDALRRSRAELPLGEGFTGHLSGPGARFRLLRRYVAAIEAAQDSVVLAHAYFLPHRSFLRALLAAAERGVRVRALLAGRSDVPLAALATQRLYRRMLSAGIEIHEWSRSPHHAKLCCVDQRHLLVGSFNLDPLSLVNRESLLEVVDHEVTKQADAWVAGRILESKSIAIDACRSPVHQWMVEPVGRVLHQAAESGAKLILWARRGAGARMGRNSTDIEPPWTP